MSNVVVVPFDDDGPKRSQPLGQTELAKLFRAHLRPSPRTENLTDNPSRNSGGSFESSPLQKAFPGTLPVLAPQHHFPALLQQTTDRGALFPVQFLKAEQASYQNPPITTMTSSPPLVEPKEKKVAATPGSPGGSSKESTTQKCHITKTTLKDGLKWRKYGQKALKNSPYPRTYYRCTTSECKAKKQIEKFIDDAGQEMFKTVYVGEHIHLNPLFIQTKVETQEQFQSSVYAQTMKGKNDDGNILEIECHPDIDCNNDGYSWRKYGQKKVKGGPHQRAYYKCAQSDCEVKKTIEQGEAGTRLCTYNGNHTHAPNDPLVSNPSENPDNIIFETDPTIPDTERPVKKRPKTRSLGPQQPQSVSPSTSGEGGLESFTDPLDDIAPTTLTQPTQGIQSQNHSASAPIPMNQSGGMWQQWNQLRFF